MTTNAWIVTLHLKHTREWDLGWGMSERPSATFRAGSADEAAQQFVSLLDQESMNGELARTGSRVYVHVRPDDAPDAPETLLRVDCQMAPQYEAYEPVERPKLRCDWWPKCHNPALPDDIFCAVHRAEEDAFAMRWSSFIWNRGAASSPG